MGPVATREGLADRIPVTSPWPATRGPSTSTGWRCYTALLHHKNHRTEQSKNALMLFCSCDPLSMRTQLLSSVISGLQLHAVMLLSVITYMLLQATYSSSSIYKLCGGGAFIGG